MKIHEYQARQLLAENGIPVPGGTMIQTVKGALEAATALLEGGATLLVVKAQVHAGGRGKAGFVTLARSIEEVETAATFMLSNRMVSPQTGHEGLDVTRLLIAEGVDIQSEFYLAITTDRTSGRNMLIASSEGGVEIEQVAHDRPEAIHRIPIHPLDGLAAHQAMHLAFDLGFTGKQVRQAARIMEQLAALYVKTDATLAEINPLVLTPPSDDYPDGQVIAVDAKFSFDDNALFRQKAIAAMFDAAEENEHELKAREFDLAYIALEGNIGCLVNGAGLAMSTMDIIKLHGGEPANFLDVGGSATQEAITEAFQIILADDAVEGVLVNIFGGIMQCDRIAAGIVTAAKQVGFTVPLVVRLEGSNVDAARRILDDARPELPTMEVAGDLEEAARLVTAAVAAV
jgi:succinyl-CoA synthetase beta subunit